jgi:peroxiredoxin
LFAGCAAAAEDLDTPQVDKRSEQILRQVADYYHKLPEFSLNLSFLTTVQAPGMRREMWAKYDITAEQPNKLAIRLTDGMGADLYSDGRQVTVSLPPMKTFTQKPAPKDFEGLFDMPEASLVNKGVGNMLFVDRLLKKNPYDAIMQNVDSAKFIGTENLGAARGHHLRIVQGEIATDLWVADGPQPWLLKAGVDMSSQLGELMPKSPNSKMTMDVTFGGWKTGEHPGPQAFAFTPPADAHKVATLFEQPENRELLGKPAPAVSLDVVGGGKLDLQAMKGKVVVLEFWASWCVPCVQSLPQAAEVTRQFKNRGVAFYAINQDEEPEVVQAFMQKRNFQFPVAVDTGSQAASFFKVSGIPFTAVIGKDGKVQAIHTGLEPDFKQKLTEELEALTSGKTLVSLVF